MTAVSLSQHGTRRGHSSSYYSVISSFVFSLQEISAVEPNNYKKGVIEANFFTEKNLGLFRFRDKQRPHNYSNVLLRLRYGNFAPQPNHS